jgi:hypothetical protein
MTKEQIIDAFLKEGYTINIKYIDKSVIITTTRGDEPYSEVVTTRQLEAEMLSLFYNMVTGHIVSPDLTIQDFDNDTYS